MGNCCGGLLKVKDQPKKDKSDVQKPSSEQVISDHQLIPKPSSISSTNMAADDKMCEDALTKEPNPLDGSEIQTSDVILKASDPASNENNHLSDAEEKEIERLVRIQSEAHQKKDVPLLSDKELKRLNQLLKKKQRMIRASCPVLIDNSLLTDEEMKKLGRIVKKETRFQCDEVSVTDSLISTGLDELHRRQKSLISLWVHSSPEVENLTRRPLISSRSLILTKVLENEELGGQILYTHGTGHDVDMINAKCEIMWWDISGKLRLKCLRKWLSADTLLVGEEYWVKNVGEPIRLKEDEMEELFVKWKETNEDILRFAYSEGKGGIIAVGKELLGAGRFSFIKHALLIRPDQAIDTAIKIIERENLPDNYDYSRLRKEVAIISALKHPHVLEVHCVFFYQQMLHILMELALNGSLYEYIRHNGTLSEERAKEWFWQLSEGLMYCHKEHVAHRDLTCKNVWLDVNDQIKIAGFHLAELHNSSTPVGKRACDINEYTAPEIVTNQQGYNPMQADLWNLGICFYVMLHGQPPFTEYQLKLYRLKGTRRVKLLQDKVDSHLPVPHAMAVQSHNVYNADDSNLLIPQINESLSNGTRHLLLELLQENPSKRPPIQLLVRHY